MCSFSTFPPSDGSGGKSAGVHGQFAVLLSFSGRDHEPFNFEETREVVGTLAEVALGLDRRCRHRMQENLRTNLVLS